jgi:hypothetical protein
MKVLDKPSLPNAAGLSSVVLRLSILCRANSGSPARGRLDLHQSRRQVLCLSWTDADRRRCRAYDAREQPVILAITQPARERIAVGGKSGFQLGPFGLGKQRFGCRQQFGLFGAHGVQLKADILLCLLLESLAARFAHQFPPMPLNLETDTIPCPSWPTGEPWRTHRASR